MSAFLRYTLLRLGLFAAMLLVFWLFGARGLLLAVLAAFASLALSYVLLRGPRDELSRTISERVQQRRPRRQSRFDRRIAEDAAAEDAAEDAAAEQRHRPPSPAP